MFTCADGYEFVARVEGEEAWVFRSEGTDRLDAIRAASGAKYASGALVFWTKGDEALLGSGDELHHECRNDPQRAVWEHAKLNGADFRAVGNEPGWNLEILEQSRIVLVSDYGAVRHEFPLPEPSADQDARTTRYRTRAEGHDLILVLRGEPCQDTMSGESFDTTVLVTLDGRELVGCGRPLH